MTLHADAQGAALAAGKLAQPLFGLIQLGQHAVGHGQQVFAGLGGAQAATFTDPEGRAQLFFQFAHGVAERRLGEVQGAGRGRERTLPVHFLDDGEVDAFKHECHSWIAEKIPFYVMSLAAYHGDHRATNDRQDSSWLLPTISVFRALAPNVN